MGLVEREEELVRQSLQFGGVERGAGPGQVVEGERHPALRGERQGEDQKQ